MRITIVARAGFSLAHLLEDELEKKGHNVAGLDPDLIVIDRRLLQTDLVVLVGPPTWRSIYAGIFAKTHGVAVLPDPEVALESLDRVGLQFLAKTCKIKMPKAYFSYPSVLYERLSDKHFPFVATLGREKFEVLNSKKDVLRLPQSGPVLLEEFIFGRNFVASYVEDEVRLFKRDRFVPHERGKVGRRKLKEVQVTTEVGRMVEEWRGFTRLPACELEFIRHDITGKYYLVGANPFPSFEYWPGVERNLAGLLLRNIKIGRYKRFREAITFAFYVHEKCAVSGEGVKVAREAQGANQPYIPEEQTELFYALHPVRMAGILFSAGFTLSEDEDLLIAALLHDVVEETTATLEDIRGMFGPAVADLVDEVTKPECQEGKVDWLKSFQFASKNAKVLKMVDRLDKLLDKDSRAWPVEEKKRYAQNAKLIYQICRDAHAGLAAELKDAIQRVLGEGDWNL